MCFQNSFCSLSHHPQAAGRSCNLQDKGVVRRIAKDLSSPSSSDCGRKESSEESQRVVIAFFSSALKKIFIRKSRHACCCKIASRSSLRIDSEVEDRH
ncbi:unnamed protein product [Sphagnum jensenii]|uniref:Uncharacterized protein n=1 Tax=Sphagnum jensenii TaxID=128206 RepID=A0ABP1BWS8_9BRYO